MYARRQDGQWTSNSDGNDAPTVGTLQCKLSRILSQHTHNPWRQLFDIGQIGQIGSLALQELIKDANVERLVDLTIAAFVAFHNLALHRS